TNENHLVFYARRLFRMDPVLTLLAAGACVSLLLRPRRDALSEPGRPLGTSGSGRVLLAWLAVTLLLLFGFRYRSAYYLLPLVPVLALMAAELFAQLPRFRGPILAALLVSVAVKTISAAPVWGISAGRESHRAVASALDRYCQQHRDNGLIIVGPDDQFY